MATLVEHHIFITTLANLSIMFTGFFLGFMLRPRKKPVRCDRYMIWFMVVTLILNVLDLFLNMRYGPVGAL